MARLPALVTAIAETDGRERPTVDHFARVIREGGFIQTAKRGSGAASMTSRDAANLLIGLNGADSAKDALIAIPQFRSLRAFPVAAMSESGDFSGVFARIKDAPTFGEALEALIEGSPDIALSFHAYAQEAYGREHADAFAIGPLAGVKLRVELSRWPVNASIRITRYVGDGRVVDAYAWHFQHDPNLLMAGFYHDPCAKLGRDSDRRTRVTFGLATTIRVAAVLLDEAAE